MEQTIQFDQVADIYDDYVNVNFDIPFFLKETENYNEKILELMCGTGRVSIPLLEAGRKLTCIDYSQGMLNAFTRKIEGKNYPVRLLHCDVTQLDLKEEFGLILLPFHSLSEILTADLQQRTLKTISEHLAENGTFICTLQNPETRLKLADSTVRFLGEFTSNAGNSISLFCMNHFDPETGLVSGFQEYIITDPSGKEPERRKLDIAFRPIPDKEFREMAKDSALKIVRMYGGYDYSPFDIETSNFMIYILRK